MKTKHVPLAEILPDPTPERYSIVDKKLIEHPDLSADSKAVMIYLLSRPSDWIIQMADIERFADCGRERRQRMLKELTKAGYLELITAQTSRGLWYKAYQMHRNPKKKR